jgi:beta-galactosidase
MHELAELQAIAHGSDSALYFQWRKSRGGFEKFHGAVVDHAGHENTRVFREVAALGKTLASLTGVAGSTTSAKVALLFDWENRWAVEGAAGPLNDGRLNYRGDCIAHYRAFWKRNVGVDMVNAASDYSPYAILVAPMLYMVSAATAERIAAFVRSGGTFVATYWSGIVDESDLCHLGGFPGPLRELLGIWTEELDALYSGETRSFSMLLDNPLAFEGRFTLRDLWESVHTEGARALARFDEDMFEGQPALTVNSYGAGKAYYLASRNEESFLDAFYGSLLRDSGVKGAWPSDEPLPEGVSVTVREGGRSSFYFVLNFSDGPHRLRLPAPLANATVLSGESDGDHLILAHRSGAVLRLDR